MVIITPSGFLKILPLVCSTLAFADTVAALPIGKYKDIFFIWQADVKERAAIFEKRTIKYHAALVRLQPLLDEGCKKAPDDF